MRKCINVAVYWIVTFLATVDGFVEIVKRQPYHSLDNLFLTVVLSLLRLPTFLEKNSV